MGDPAGIGPEILVKALSRRDSNAFRPVVVGAPEVIAAAATALDVAVEVRTVADLADVESAAARIDVLAPAGIDAGGIPFGVVDARAGAAAGLCLTHALDLAAAGQVEGLVSAPVNKQALHLAWHCHDEIDLLADRSGAADPVLFGVVQSVWTVPVTLHVPLREVAELVTRERVLHRVRALHQAIENTGGNRPAIAVCGLNPHAGDGGLLGTEEVEHITPAIAEARALGIDAHGPVPADTVFPRAFAGEFAGVVCMYHDQANIARKLSSLAAGATVVVGLPVPFATTAHGTAFDQAGLGTADPGSIERALDIVIAQANRAREERLP